jgi:hypothetical protein
VSDLLKLKKIKINKDKVQEIRYYNNVENRYKDVWNRKRTG